MLYYTVQPAHLGIGKTNLWLPDEITLILFSIAYVSTTYIYFSGRDAVVIVRRC